MGKHTQEKGKEGETLARRYLAEKGYAIRETNWRSGKAEIDLIAEWDGMPVFVEVKTRSSRVFGQPEDFLGRKQRERLVSAAMVYMEEIAYEGEIRFDLIAIHWPAGGSPSLRHFEDAFFPGLAG